ncbi:hypothetical protein TWF481_002867 [Arthrobotrys musiformis]|uniref:HNH nuclease domain-containing protein n=1 Tax=Arthrobotrys musiformis TaxID=47236 RepID=A0AAV9VTE6_9PEZI
MGEQYPIHAEWAATIAELPFSFQKFLSIDAIRRMGTRLADGQQTRQNLRDIKKRVEKHLALEAKYQLRWRNHYCREDGAISDQDTSWVPTLKLANPPSDLDAAADLVYIDAVFADGIYICEERGCLAFFLNLSPELHIHKPDEPDPEGNPGMGTTNASLSLISDRQRPVVSLADYQDYRISNPDNPDLSIFTIDNSGPRSALQTLLPQPESPMDQTLLRHGYHCYLLRSRNPRKDSIKP